MRNSSRENDDKCYKKALLGKYFCPNCKQSEYVPDPFEGVHCLLCAYKPGQVIDGKLNTNRALVKLGGNLSEEL